MVAELRKRGVAVPTLYSFSSNDDPVTDARFLDWRTGDVDVRAGRFASALDSLVR